MRIQLRRFILFSLLSATLFGCDKLCKKQLDVYTTVQNATNRQLILTVCKGRAPGERDITVPQTSMVSEISLGQEEGSEVRGGLSASCSGVQNERQLADISLAPKSFGTVKFCFDSVARRTVIVENFQFCPTGYQEQLAATNCLTL